MNLKNIRSLKIYFFWWPFVNVIILKRGASQYLTSKKRSKTNKNKNNKLFYAYINNGGNKFSHMGVSPKWVKSKRWREKEREERLNDGNNNDKLHIVNATSGGARKAAWAKISIWLR